MIDRLDRRMLIAAGLAAPLLGAAPVSATTPAADPRRRERLADGWRFHLGHAADAAKDFGWGHDLRTFAKAGFNTADAALPTFDDAAWQSVQVPHDWAVDLPYVTNTANPSTKPDEDDPRAAHGFKAIGRDYPANSVGWYRRALDILPEDAGRAVWLEFDGVFRDAIVFVNGYVVHANASGYAPFRVEIGDFLDYAGGPNVLALRVNASLGEGWFYEGAGIYRHVELVSAAALHVPQWGVLVRPSVEGASARIAIEVEVANASLKPAAATVRHTIFAPDGSSVASVDAGKAAPLPAGKVTLASEARVRAPQLWSVEMPVLYRLVTEVIAGGAVIDSVETLFGIRSIAFSATDGFRLNGKQVKLLGACNHQDHAGVGTAIPDALHAWRIAQLQGMGANAWRSAHNPPPQALLDACDRVGMMMIVEARLNSTSDEATDELDRILLSCRNHPSVILWSVGNEEPHQGSERGARISEHMTARVKALDPTRPTTQAFDNGFETGASRVVDVIGFNYRTDKIEAFHAKFPDQPIIGTETGSTVSTRGAYANDAAKHVVRAYDTEHPWWASTAEEWWTIAAAHPYIAGGFIWTGFDYRGEPTPYGSWPSVSSYFGALDLCGFPKDNYFYYRAWWRPNEPMVHLLPHWNWRGREGQPIAVWAYANADEVELLLNGRSLGRKPMPRNRHLEWQVPYAPGQLEARGFTGGRLVASDVRETTGAPAAVRLSADRQRYAADGADVAMIRAEIVDAAGRVVPTGADEVSFAIAGPARLIGLGNGDPTSHEPDHGSSRRAFAGLCQAIVQTGATPGLVTVAARAPGLKPCALTLSAVPPQGAAA